MVNVIIEMVALFLSGILAGEEFVISAGVRAPVAVLDDKPQIQLRQALIRRLRVLVPAIFLPMFVLAIVGISVEGIGLGFGFRCAGVLALLTWFLVTLIGTVPINKGALDWHPDAPPSNWRELISRWERLDTVRTWAAVLAFAFLLTAIGVQLAGS